MHLQTALYKTPNAWVYHTDKFSIIFNKRNTRHGSILVHWKDIHSIYTKKNPLACQPITLTIPLLYIYTNTLARHFLYSANSNACSHSFPPAIKHHPLSSALAQTVPVPSIYTPLIQIPGAFAILMKIIDWHRRVCWRDGEGRKRRARFSLTFDGLAFNAVTSCIDQNRARIQS